MTYELAYTEEAKSHLAKLAKDEPKVFQKALRFLETEVIVLVLAAYGHYNDK